MIISIFRVLRKAQIRVNRCSFCSRYLISFLILLGFLFGLQWNCHQIQDTATTEAQSW
jgi:hypothetical protein